VLPQPPATRPVDRWGTNAAIERVRALGRESDNLAADEKELPGRDAADHSRIMQRIFTDLLQILPLMGDANQDRVLKLRMAVIQTARADLASGAAALRIEPTIDNALRNAIAALSDLSHTDSFEEADVAKDLDSLSASLNPLDQSERSPAMHRVDVTETVDLISKLVSKMSASLSARLTVEQPGTGPAAAPSTQPISPATEPAAPATAPAAPATSPAGA
jgi:hypothetical protein